MTKGQKIKNLIKQRGLDPEMVAKAMGLVRLLCLSIISGMILRLLRLNSLRLS